MKDISFRKISILLLLYLIIGSHSAFCAEKVVVIPLLGSSSEKPKMVEVRVDLDSTTQYACTTLFLAASCPEGMKITGGGVTCGRNGPLFSSPFRAVSESGKAWGQEQWFGTCIHETDNTRHCAPQIVWAFCIESD